MFRLYDTECKTESVPTLQNKGNLDVVPIQTSSLLQGWVQKDVEASCRQKEIQEGEYEKEIHEWDYEVRGKVGGRIIPMHILY